MAKNKVTKVSLEDEFNTLKRHFGGIIATVKALKETVDTLQKKLADIKLMVSRRLWQSKK